MLATAFDNWAYQRPSQHLREYHAGCKFGGILSNDISKPISGTEVGDSAHVLGLRG
jgi:hypothetical protein